MKPPFTVCIVQQINSTVLAPVHKCSLFLSPCNSVEGKYSNTLICVYMYVCMSMFVACECSGMCVCPYVHMFLTCGLFMGHNFHPNSFKHYISLALGQTRNPLDFQVMRSNVKILEGGDALLCKALHGFHQCINCHVNGDMTQETLITLPNDISLD